MYARELIYFGIALGFMVDLHVRSKFLFLDSRSPLVNMHIPIYLF